MKFYPVTIPLHLCLSYVQLRLNNSIQYQNLDVLLDNCVKIPYSESELTDGDILYWNHREHYGNIPVTIESDKRIIFENLAMDFHLAVYNIFSQKE